MNAARLALYMLPVTINTLLGIVVFINNPKSKTNRYFVAMIASIVAWTITLLFYYQTTDPIALLHIGRINFVPPSFIVLFLVLFALNFPHQTKGIQYKLLTNTIVTWTILTSIVTLFTPFITAYELLGINDTRITIYGPLYATFIIHFVTLSLVALLILGRKYEKASGVERKQLAIIMIGFSLGLILATVTNVFIPLFERYFVTQELGPILTLTMTGTITYAIIKHQFLDVRTVVARAVSGTLTIALIAFFYASYLFIIGTIFTGSKIDTKQLIIAIILALIISLTLQPIKAFVDKSTESIFFKTNYDAQKLLYHLSKITSSTFELKQLTNQILQEITETIKISDIAIVLFNTNNQLLYNHSGSDTSWKNLSSKTLQYFINRAKAQPNKMLILDDLRNGKVHDMMAKNKIVLLSPLFIKNKVIGAIILGRKMSGEIYNNKDIKTFKILFPEMSIAINNALSYEQIKRFNITLKEKVKEATAKLRKANRELRELDTLKDEFVSIASHELRTPMTAIKSYLWLVVNRSKSISKKDKEHLKIAYDSTERLIDLVNEMLVISRIEGKRLELHLDKMDMVHTARQVVDELQFTAQEKHIQIIMDSSSPTLYIMGDNAKIGEVVQNLVGNALKFTPEGGRITITLGYEKDDVVLKVSDTGPGIPKKDIPKLFIKFSKLTHAYKNISNVHGSGLGLYISKQIIGLHKGSIDIESKVGKGTTFIVKIPAYKE